MKIPSINSITKPIKKTLVAAMIAAPTTGAMHSCASMPLCLGEVATYPHYIPVRPIAPPPPRTNVYIHTRPTPPPQPPKTHKPHTNKHGDTFQRGESR